VATDPSGLESRPIDECRTFWSRRFPERTPKVRIDVSLDDRVRSNTNAYGMFMKMRISVHAENLDNLQIRMLINSSTDRRHWDGKKMSLEDLRKEIDADPVVIDTQGQWKVDTGWNWQDVKPELLDNQLINVWNEKVTIGDTIYTVVRRAITTRDFIIEVRDKKTKEVLRTHEWGYVWRNRNANWGWMLKPPPPAEYRISARAGLGAGGISSYHGISGGVGNLKEK